MAYLRFPDGNPIRIVRTDNQSSTKQDYSTRLTHQLVGPHFIYKESFMAFKAEPASILFQLWTDYYYEVTLHNYATGVEVAMSYSVSTVTIDDATYGIVDVDNITIDASLLGGYYYLQFRFSETSSGGSDEVWKTEYFQVGNFDTDDYVQIKYTSAGEFGVYNSGVETFQFYINARNVDMKLGMDKSLSVSYDGQLSNLYSIAHLYCQLDVAAVQFWVWEKLNLASCHKTFYLNGVEYQNDSPITPKVQGNDLIKLSSYTGNILYRRKNYQDYTVLENQEAPTAYPIWVDATEVAIYIDADDNYLIYQT